MTTHDEPDAGEDELREVEALVRGAQLQTTRAFDERVLADSAASRGSTPRSLRIAAGIVVAIALGGALTAAVGGWVRRGDRPSGDGTPMSSALRTTDGATSQAPVLPSSATAERTADHGALPPTENQGPSALADADPEVEEEVQAAYMSGISPNADARETMRETPIVARIVGRGLAGRSRTGYDLVRGEIVALYKGDPALVGRTVILHEKHREYRTSLLCWSWQNARRIEKGSGTYLIPLEPTNVGIPPTGPVHLRLALGEGLNGTLVSDVSPRDSIPATEDEMVNVLRDDLVANLSVPDPVIRVSAMTALSRWSGKSGEGTLTDLWNDANVAKRLLAAGRDVDPRVRREIEWMLTRGAGEAGRDLLEEMLADSDSAIRSYATGWFFTEHPEVRAELEAASDGWWAGSLSNTQDVEVSQFWQGTSEQDLRALREDREPMNRMFRAWALGKTGPSKATSDALLAALDDPDFEVRRGAAHSLGMVGGEAVPDRLDGIANTEDPRVRVMAAWSQVNLGDRRGYAHLSRLVTGDDARAAAQACTALGRIAKKESVALLLTAGEDKRAVVRGAVVVALARRALKDDAPHRDAVAALLANAEKDEDAYVRATARAALSQRERAGATVGSGVIPEHAKLLKALGYVVGNLPEVDPDDE